MAESENKEPGKPEEEGKPEQAQPPAEEQPTRVMRPVAVRRRLGDALRAVRGLTARVGNPFLSAALLVLPLALVVFLGTKLLGGGDGDGGSEPPAVVRSADSSWIEGQASLVSYPDFLTVADLANLLGEERLSAYADLLALIERRHLREDKLERLRALQALLAECRAARERYKLAVREAERQRKEEEKRILAEQRKVQREIARLREKYKTPPGQECEIPEVAELFDCETGYPFDKPKPAKEVVKLPEPPPAPKPAKCVVPGLEQLKQELNL